MKSSLRRRLLAAGCLLLFSAPAALADVTLTGNIKTVGTAAVGSKLLVRFELQNCVVSGQNIPRVIGTGILNQTYFDYPVDASGNIVAADGGTAKIYGNDQITCDTLGNSWYRVWIIYERDKQFYGEFDVTGSSFNLNSATPRTPGASVYSPVAVLTNPAGSQTITQPANTTFTLLQSVTGASSTTAFALTPTWNTSGTPIALAVNVTDTASSASSLLIDLKTGGNAKFRVDKSGVGYLASNFLPLTDNTADLGSGSFRWRTGYFGTSVVSDGDISAPGLLITGTGTHSASTRYIDAGGAAHLQYNVATGSSHKFSVNGVVKLDINASNLTTSGVAATSRTGILFDSTTTGYHRIWFTNTSGSAMFGVNDSTGSLGTGTAYGAILGTLNATALELMTNNVVRLSISSAGTSTFSGSAVGPVFQSSTATPATAGIFRGASADADLLCWRNNANGANICLNKSGAVSGGISADTLDLTQFGMMKLKGRVMFTGTAPTCTFTSGGGTTPSCALQTGSTDAAGVIQATTGTGSPGTSGDITLTFSATYGTNAPACTFTLSNAGAGQWNGRATPRDKTPATGSDVMTWDNNSVALSVSTAYHINYSCGAK